MSLLPSVRATWALSGQTPVLRHHFAWKRLSIAGVLAYEPMAVTPTSSSTGYAPDLNPIEQVWGSVKSQELANLCADTIGEV